MQKEVPIDRQSCPLCGQRNHCALASGASIDECWCMTTPVSRSILATLPEQQRNTVCVCKVCGAATAEVDNE